MKTLPIERKITIPFNIQSAKSSIEMILNADKEKYFAQERSALLGSYSFSVTMPMMQNSRMNISLRAVGEGETELTIINSVGSGQLTPTLLNQIVDDFIRLLERALTGEEISAETVSKETAGGCAGIVLIAITIGFLTAYFIA